MRKDGALHKRSFAFTLRVVKLYQYLCEERREYVPGKQVPRSGTAIGAMVRDAEQAEIAAGFIHKLSIALNEAKEIRQHLTPFPADIEPRHSRP